jgi:hypothetical protein
MADNLLKMLPDSQPSDTARIERMSVGMISVGIGVIFHSVCVLADNRLKALPDSLHAMTSLRILNVVRTLSLKP